MEITMGEECSPPVIASGGISENEVIPSTCFRPPEMEGDHLLSLNTGRGENRKDVEGTDSSSAPRYLLFQTACLGIANCVLGIAKGRDATAYLDLLLITGSDLQSGSTIFTLAGVGAILGSICAAPLCDKFPTELMLTASLMGAGLFTVIIPWFQKLAFMLMSTFVGWAFIGLLEAALPLLLIELWGSEDGPYTHIIYLCYAVGGMIGPFLTELFISPLTKHAGSLNNSSSPIVNASTAFEDSRVFIPYFIVSSAFELIAFVWLGVYFKNRKLAKKKDDDEEEDDESSESEKKREKRSQKHQIIVLLLLGGFFVLYDGIENCFDDFLMAFMVAQFGWTKSLCARAVTVFWTGYTGGKVCGIWLSKVVSPCTLIVVCLAGMNITLVLWVVLASGYSDASWILIGLMGLFMSIVFPAGISLTNSYQSGVSSKVMSWIMTCADVGNTLNPLLMGYLLQNTIPISYVYLLIAEAGLCLGIIVLVAVIVKKHQPD